jgi:acyl transferase domain-containing protein/SAM-dependent methyltransferase/acyl carrier protein
VGSVKTNIGHAEAAAGIAGLIKAVLMLRHQAIPASLHFRRLNPHIELGGVPITVPVELTPRALRYAGVSSFGFSGTNAHVVLERADGGVLERADGGVPERADGGVLERADGGVLEHADGGVLEHADAGVLEHADGGVLERADAVVPEHANVDAEDPAADRRPARVLPLSARDPAALDALAAAWSARLAEPGADFAALCHTAGAGRARFAHRLAVVAADAAAARAALETVPRGIAGKPRVGFLCTGQGSAYAGMAAGLAETAPVFAAVLARCDAVMGLDRRLADVFTDAAALARTDHAQPALYALSAGLGALWRSWGIEPVAVLGHSVGEYAAAHLAGVLTLEDGARLIAGRGRLMQALPAGGGMAVLLGAEAAARAVLARHGELEIAGFNAAAALTVAGPEAAIDRLLADAALAGGELTGQKLELRHAFHSRLLEPMLAELEAAAATVPHHAPLLPVVGNLDGGVVARHDAAYWRAHARAPVRFAAGLATLAGLGCTHLVELGAQPTLLGLARGCGLTGLPSLVRPRAGQAAEALGWTTLLEALARLWRDGAAVDWVGHDAPYRPKVADAPGYAFQRQRYWFQSQAKAVPALLAGERIELATGGTVFRGRLDSRDLPFLADHVVLGETIVPGASHIVTLLSASGAALSDIVFAAPLNLPDGGCATQVYVRDNRIELHADAAGAWTLHTSATVAPVPPVPPPVDHAAIMARCVADPDGPAALHAMLETRGITLGPSFRGITRLFRGENEALVEVALPADVPAVPPLHPAQLDACFQALGATFQGSGAGGAFLPLAVDRVVLHRNFSGPLWAHVQAQGSGGASTEIATGDVTLFDADGELIASITGLTIKRVGTAAADMSQRWTYEVAWTAREEHSTTLPPPEALAALVEAARDATAPQEPPSLAEGLERLAAAYAAQALAAVAPASVAPGQQRLFAHLPTMAAGAGGQPESLAAALTAQHGERMEIALCRRSGRALAAVLRGEADPLAVLFGDGDGASVYAEPPFARMLNAMIVAALRGMIDALPPGRRLRILEIGAGTGAVFAALQATVPQDRVAYTFTDVSPVFLDTASSGFGAALECCAPLDIERPPEAQGFTSGSYDVVLAANVLHATRELGDSLRHAARLLAPHGVLLLLEAVGRSNWADLVFGLTPGWWRFADTARRPSHPLLAQPAWQALLAEHFAEVTAVASPGDGQQMLAIAHRPRPERPVLVWEAPAGLAPLDLADSALQVVQRALAETRPPALRLITRGAQPVAECAIDVDQSVLLGLGRVIAIEHPELDLRLLDLPPGIPATVADSVPADLKEAAWRNGVWHSPNLIRVSLPREPVFTTGGTHLITGGLGGLGALLVAWLLERGAARVVLMARNARSGMALPANVTLVIGDAARPEEVRRVVHDIGEELRGVFHLAGTLSDAAILRLSRDDLARVFAGKVEGARNLDVAVGTRALDAFVLFGSSTGLIGNPGQGAHAAANAYLAAVAQHRQQRGLTGLCVDWGAWGEAGTLTRSSVGDRLVAAGAALMPPAGALSGLSSAIVAGKARVLVAAIEWPRFLAGYGDAIPAFYAAVAPPRRAVAAAGQAAADPRASRAALAAFVANAAGRVLGAAAGEAPAPDAPLNEAGLDSLMALELRKALSVGLDLTLPATLLFNFPTIDALIEHLAPQVGLAEVQAAPAPLPSPPPPDMAPDTILESVMRMSEAEMAEVIAREFAFTVAARG